MKKHLLILLAAVIGMAASGAFAQDRLEKGKFKSHRTGQTILALYVVSDGQYKEVHLFMPDGRDIGIACEPGISSAKLDHGLQQIIDAQ